MELKMTPIITLIFYTQGLPIVGHFLTWWSLVGVEPAPAPRENSFSQSNLTGFLTLCLKDI